MALSLLLHLEGLTRVWAFWLGQVLLGDAAHSLLNVTHLGTGLALEDGLVLDRLLQGALESQEDGSDVTECIARALSDFSKERIPEMAAAAQLCSEVSRTNM
jgi:2-polyprenyl-6-methoxyphenol hydroxylase-like FAD-dependent oxidoreductase